MPKFVQDEAVGKGLSEGFGTGKINSLKWLVRDESLTKLKIAGINQCGALHPILKDLPNLYYSEYQTARRLESVRHENLESLTYRDVSLIWF